MWTSPGFSPAEPLLACGNRLSRRWGSLLLYPGLLGIAWQLRHLPLRGLMQGLIAGCALLAWWLYYRRYRAVADTPTARTRSAALGYTELFGQARAHDKAPLFSPISGRPCVWYRWEKCYQGSGYQRKTRERGQSEASFLLADASGGEIVIHPEQAEVQPMHRRQKLEEGWQITEDWIAAGDPLYALGQLAAIGGAPDERTLREDIRLALEQLKRDRPWLLAHYDSNRDGEIDQAEWETARARVSAEVRRDHASLAATPVTLHLSAPGDGRHFLLSHRAPGDAASHFRHLAWLHLSSGALALLLLSRLA